MTIEEIDAAAQAIRTVFADRVYRDTDFSPTPWEKLRSCQREGYREEAKAALEAAEKIRERQEERFLRGGINAVMGEHP